MVTPDVVLLPTVQVPALSDARSTALVLLVATSFYNEKKSICYKSIKKIFTIQLIPLESDVDNTPAPVFLNDVPHPSVPGLQI